MEAEEEAENQRMAGIERLLSSLPCFLDTRMLLRVAEKEADSTPLVHVVATRGVMTCATPLYEPRVNRKRKGLCGPMTARNGGFPLC